MDSCLSPRKVHNHCKTRSNRYTPPIFENCNSKLAPTDQQLKTPLTVQIMLTLPLTASFITAYYTSKLAKVRELLGAWQIGSPYRGSLHVSDVCSSKFRICCSISPGIVTPFNDIHSRLPNRTCPDREILSVTNNDGR